MSQITLPRLHIAIAAVAPIDGVSILDHEAQQVRIDYSASAMAGDIAAGDAALAAFDWSDTQDASFLAQASNKGALASVDRGITLEGNPVDRLLVAMALVTQETFNADRAAMTAMNNAVQAATSLADLKTRFASINFPQQITPAQVLNAVKAKLTTLPT